MDKLYERGLSELFLLIALAAAKKFQINLEFSHLDSSSFSVHGHPVLALRRRGLRMTSSI